MERLGLVLLMVFYFPVHASTVYKYIDRDGNVVYTNTPVEGADRPKLPQLSTYTIPKVGGAVSTGHASLTKKISSSSKRVVPGKESSNFPMVDAQTQRTRDMSRRNILEQELNVEEKALAEAKRFLDMEEKKGSIDNQAQRYRNAVLDHEKNIDAIRKEISRL